MKSVLPGFGTYSYGTCAVKKSHAQGVLCLGLRATKGKSFTCTLHVHIAELAKVACTSAVSVLGFRVLHRVSALGFRFQGLWPMAWMAWG